MINSFKLFNFLRGLPVIIVYSSLPDKKKINMDIERFELTPNCLNLIDLMKKERPFRRIFYERVKEQTKIGYYLVRWTYPTLIGFDIGTDISKIGGGLRVYHGYSTIIHSRGIGENCSVFQNVTIGKGKTVNGVNYPILGDNVCVYTGAMVLGGCTIGNNVTIGAGTLVLGDVPDNCTVVGNPMRIINK